jgi:hypothetical protein
VEELVKKKGKKIIYVLNKADLVEKKPKPDLYPYALVSCVLRKGVRELRALIKRQAKELIKENHESAQVTNGKKEERINVGIIGYPNTGKSSLINILIGKNSAKTAAEAGFTKGLQKLKLSPEILLIDSPGIIPREKYSATDREALTHHTKVGGRSYSQIKEPEMIVSELMKEFPGVFEKFYKIDTDSNPEILIEILGKQKGLLKKKGEVNEDQTARMILKDWQEGRIKT